MMRTVMMVSRCETETSSYAEVLSTSDDECRNQNGSSSAVLCNTRELCALHMYIFTIKRKILSFQGDLRFLKLNAVFKLVCCKN